MLELSLSSLLIHQIGVLQLGCEVSLDSGHIFPAERCLFLLLRLSQSFGLGFPRQYIDPVDFCLFHGALPNNKFPIK